MTTRQISEILVYPQDTGTTPNHPHPGDPHSAAMKAAYSEALRGLDFVASGFEISSDGNAIDIDSGKAILTAESATVDWRTDIEFGGEPLSDAAFLAHAISDETGISLESSGTNHVYLAIDMSENNTGEYHVVSEETDTLGDISLKIGEVDGGSVELANRNDAVEDHQENGVHNEPQPPDEHGNEAHSETFAIDGDAQPPQEHGHDVSEIDGAASEDDLESRSQVFIVDSESDIPSDADEDDIVGVRE